jgi:hypothetical protein
MSAEDKRREQERRELAALADGSLPFPQRMELERKVAQSPRLQAMLAEQRRALTAVRALDQRAPDHVRSAIATARNRRRPPARRVAALGIAAAAASVAVVLILLPGSEEATPSLAQAAAIAGRVPPRASPDLSQAWGLDFPALERSGGWKDLGSRVDRVGNREARTAYYARDGRRIAYTILSSGKVRVPSNTQPWHRKGKSWYRFDQAGRTVVAWERHGHMCVVSASGLDSRRLVDLITR